MHETAKTSKTVPGDHRPPKDVKKFLDSSNYARLRQLGVRGWFDELTRLYELSIECDLKLHRIDTKIETLTIGGRTKIYLPGAPLAQLVAPANNDVLVPKHLLPALVININAPDEIVRKQFEMALAQARKQFPSAFSKPGPRAPNSLFDARTFLSWRNAQIVPLADVLAWNARRTKQGLPSYPEYVLGGWLGLPDRPATNRAKNTLKKALASLPALAAQLKYDSDHRRVAEMQAEAQSLLDPNDLELAARWV